MLDIRNRTPFAADLAPMLDKHGREAAVIAIKGTFAIRNKAQALQPAEKQEPIVTGDVYHGEPEASSLKFESDMLPPRPGTDVSLLGHAYARGPDKPWWMRRSRSAGLRRPCGCSGIGCGSRPWGSGSPAIRFPSRRFRYCTNGPSGAWTNPIREKKHALERRNPVGTGFVTQARMAFGKTCPCRTWRIRTISFRTPTTNPRPPGSGCSRALAAPPDLRGHV